MRERERERETESIGGMEGGKERQSCYNSSLNGRGAPFVVTNRELRNEQARSKYETGQNEGAAAGHGQGGGSVYFRRK